MSKCNTHFEHSFLIDKCSCKMVNTPPSDIFNSSAISSNSNLRLAKTSLLSFLVFSRETAKFGQPEHSASFVSVQPHLVSIPPLKHCFQQSRVRITFIKPLLCLNSIFFPSESNALSSHKIQIFALF